MTHNRRSDRRRHCPRRQAMSSRHTGRVFVTQTVHRDAGVFRPSGRASPAWRSAGPGPRRMLRPADRPAQLEPPKSRATPTTDRATAPSSTQTDRSTTAPDWCHQTWQHATSQLLTNRRNSDHSPDTLKFPDSYGNPTYSELPTHTHPFNGPLSGTTWVSYPHQT